MPKLKSLNLTDYATLDRFNHYSELESFIIDLYQRGIIKSSSGRYAVDFCSSTIYIECNRLEDVIKHGNSLIIKSVSLHSWISKWTSQTTISHTMIDETTLFTLLKVIRNSFTLANF